MIDSFHVELTTDFSNLVIRPVEKADLPTLEWGQKYIKYRRMFARLYNSTQSGDTLMWLIQVPQGELIGQTFVMLRSSDHSAANGDSRAYLFAFRVKPHWRNRGIGSWLMHFVENDLYRRGFKYLTLNVAKDNPDALRLYIRLGYKITGSRPGIWSYVDHKGHVHTVKEPAWRMEKRLPLHTSLD